MFVHAGEISRALIEIAILWFVFYLFLLFIRGTRAMQLLKGLVVLFIIFVLTWLFELYTINWILTRLFAFSVIAFLVIFQPELRRALAQLGQNRIFTFLLREEQVIKELVESVTALSKRKIGAIVAIEREADLKVYIESGVALDSRVSRELINTIFMPTTPLHDGGVVISGDRIVAAGCLFPLTQNPRISPTLGTRHRAALGLSEETDAVVIVVSEETGMITIAVNGNFSHDLDEEKLTGSLRSLFQPEGRLHRDRGYPSLFFRRRAKPHPASRRNR